MLTRRRFIGNSAMASALWASRPLLGTAFGQEPPANQGQPLRLAIVGSVYKRGSEMQNIADRFLIGYPHDGEWYMPNVRVVSMYVDSRARWAAAKPSSYALSMRGLDLAPAGATVRKPGTAQVNEHARELARRRREQEETGPADDLTEARAKQFGFRVSPNIPDALRCGGDRIAVDAVLTVVEQDGYPSNDRGEILLPSFDFFQQCAQVFEEEKHAVPYFNSRQLSFSFNEAQSMVNTASRLGFPLLAGSSMPVTWRLPGVDVPMGAKVEEAVVVGVGSLDGMAFDALDAMQSMLERRAGGETGVKAVQLLEGDDVWAAAKAGRWSQDLLSSALSRSDTPQGLTLLDGRTQDLAAPGILPQLVKNPAAYCIEYKDGTRGTLLMLNGAIQDFNIALRTGSGPVSCQFFLPPPPNNLQNACLTAKIEQMFETRSAPYPVQRTLLTTGILEACLRSRHQLNQRLETPNLAVRYRPPAESQFARA